MIEANFTAYVPVNLWDPILTDLGVSIQETVDQLIEACKKSVVHFEGGTISEVKVRRIDKNEVPDISKLQVVGLSPEYPEHQFIRFDTCLAFDDQLTKNESPEMSQDDIEGLILLYPVEVLKKVIIDLTIACNIARPGTFRIFPGVIYQNNLFVELTSGMMSDLSLALETARKLEWPLIKDLEVYKVITWLNEGSYLSKGISETRVDRALNAFGHLFENDPSKFGPLHIFWAMIGIEALYCDNNVNIMGQVRKKAQLFLGKQKKYKKTISRMYDYRSRFIHGNMNFPNKYLDYSTPEIEKYHQNSFQSEDIAIAILVASIQELVQRGLHDISFSYQLDIIS